MAQTMTFPAHLRATLVLGLPLIGGQLGQMLIQITDAVMMGWYGVTELAALVVATSIIFVILILGSGFAWGVMPMVAAASEAGDDVQVRRVTRMGIWASLGYCLLALPPLLLTPDLFGKLGQSPDVAALADRYFAIALWGVVPALLIMALRSFLAGLEHTHVVLWVTLLAAAVNAVLNYALIFGHFGCPELGIRGAAWASVASQCAAAMVLIWYARWKEPQREIFRRLWRPDWVAFAQVFRLGLPIGITSLAEVGLFSFASVLMGWVGTLDLAAHGIALQCATATFMVHLGLSQAATVRAGRAFGRRDALLLAQGAKAALLLSGLAAVMTVAAFLSLPETLIGWFLDPADPQLPQIVAIGVSLLAAAALFQVADAAQVMALGLLRGVQDTRVPMIYAAISYWLVGAPVAYLLGIVAGLGGVGIWLGLASGLILAGVFMMRRFWTRAVPRLAAA
ncbi:MAG: MATE family efflux transporter [Rhodobacteraceae bacterium]|nr:MATE family efflux transporter [Paracoccaceae bacterium]